MKIIEAMDRLSANLATSEVIRDEVVKDLKRRVAYEAAEFLGSYDEDIQKAIENATDVETNYLERGKMWLIKVTFAIPENKPLFKRASFQSD